MTARKKDSIVLLIRCKDRKGIVARVSGFIHDFGGNILDSDHHTDEETNAFLMRMEFPRMDFSCLPAIFRPPLSRSQKCTRCTTKCIRPTSGLVSVSWSRNRITVWPTFSSGTVETSCTSTFPSSFRTMTPALTGQNSSRFRSPSIPSRRKPNLNKNNRS